MSISLRSVPSLPNELQLRIIYELQPEYARVAAIVCRTWQHPAEAIVWARIESFKVVVAILVGARRCEGSGEEWEENTEVPQTIDGTRMERFFSIAAHVQMLTLTRKGNIFLPPQTFLDNFRARVNENPHQLFPRLKELAIGRRSQINLLDWSNDRANVDHSEAALVLLLAFAGSTVTSFGAVLRQITIHPDLIVQLMPNLSRLSLLWESVVSSHPAHRARDGHQVPVTIVDQHNIDGPAPQAQDWSIQMLLSLKHLGHLRDLTISTGFFSTRPAVALIGDLTNLASLTLVQHRGMAQYNWSFAELKERAFSNLRRWDLLCCHPGQCRPLMEHTAILEGLTDFFWSVDFGGHLGYMISASDATGTFKLGPCLTLLGRRGMSIQSLTIKSAFPTRSESLPRLRDSERAAFSELENCPQLKNLDMEHVLFPSNPDLMFTTGHWPSVAYLNISKAQVKAACLPGLAAAFPSLLRLAITIVDGDPPMSSLVPLVDAEGTVEGVFLDVLVRHEWDEENQAGIRALRQYLNSFWPRPVLKLSTLRERILL